MGTFGFTSWEWVILLQNKVELLVYERVNPQRALACVRQCGHAFLWCRKGCSWKSAPCPQSGSKREGQGSRPSAAVLSQPDCSLHWRAVTSNILRGDWEGCYLEADIAVLSELYFVLGSVSLMAHSWYLLLYNPGRDSLLWWYLKHGEYFGL